MNNKHNQSQSDLIMEYYENNPNRNIPHPEIVDWAVKEYKKRTGQTFRDPDRAIRKLAQEGKLIKITKGVYRYDPKHVVNRKLQDFSAEQKKQILERDGYKCVVCGRGSCDGIELHVDHIKAKDLGGTNDISNGQTLCAPHNFQKKNYKQTESGKRFFIRLYEAAKKNGDTVTQDFCSKILGVYEENHVNGHIEWKRWVNVTEKKFRHRISKSEVRYGRLHGIKKDGTEELYASMPEYFKIHIQGHTLVQKRFRANKIYISEEIMGRFEEGSIIEIYKDDYETIVVDLVSE